MTTKTETTQKKVLTRQSSGAARQAVARLDWASARFVEEAIKLQPVHGTLYAADFMKNRMIDIDVALRVLLKPMQRRKHIET